ncbi:MAG: hypothetical protein V1921_04440 [Candidatus Altiarchaeota archaeon]
MKHNVNFLLFGLLLLTIISMLLLGLYYRSTYMKLNTRYRDAISDVNKVAQDLNSTLREAKAKEELLNAKEKQLSSYMGELNLSKERESFFGEHFTELKDEKTGLEQDLNTTLYEKERLSGLYYDAKQEYDVCSTDLGRKAAQLNTATIEIQRITSITTNMRNTGSELSSTMTSAKSKASDVEGTAESIDSKVSQVTDSDLRGQLESDVTKMKSDLNSLERKLDDLQSQVNAIITGVEDI